MAVYKAMYTHILNLVPIDIFFKKSVDLLCPRG
eukprot:SAG31_NODE_24728_length_475_cov_0.954787_2_plen_32_part_01